MTNILNLMDHARFAAEKLAKVALFESPRALLDLYCLEPGQEQRVHQHDDIDKVYVGLSGAALVTVGDEATRLGPLQAALAPAGAPHGVRNDGAERAVLLVFQARTPKEGRGLTG